MMSGLSTQTMLGMAICSFLAVAKKFYYPIFDVMHHRTRPTIDAEWTAEMLGWLADAILLSCSVYLLTQRQRVNKSRTDDKDVEDDFARRQTRFVWFKMFDRSPPANLHWGAIYLATIVLSFLAIFAQVKFSPATMFDWARTRPTAMIAVVINFLRGVALLPQLHLSRRIGHVAPGPALWIALKGVVDLMELVSDGFLFTEICYFMGDILTFLFSSDFLVLFIRSKARGQAVVEVGPDV